MVDWLYSEAGNFNLPDARLCEQIDESLHNAASGFRANAKRIHDFWRLAPELVERASLNLVHFVNTVHAFTGKPWIEKQDYENPEFQKQIQEEFQRRLENKTASHIPDYVVQRFAQLISTIPDIEEAIQATFSAQLTSAWTAFESLAGDLWEAAVNKHPTTLANLSGEPNRINKIANEKREVAVSKKGYPPEIISEVTYSGFFDSSERQGTLLRRRMKFQLLRGIRAAYSAAFSIHNQQIDGILADHCLDKLNLVRNIIAHKAGIMDKDFVDRAEPLTWSVLIEEEKTISLNGQFVKELINPVFRCGEKLILAVSKWMAEN